MGMKAGSPASLRAQERAMTNNRQIAIDASFVILYIGLAAGMACLTITLAILGGLGFEMTATHVAAGVANAAGWLLVAAAPVLYRRVLGAGFSWRQNAVLGDVF
jgi:hypothetical protein